MSSKTDRYGLRVQRRPTLVPPFVHALPKNTGRSLAVFDADGTLWVNDVADDFTTLMIDQKKISGERWPTYMRIYRDDPPAGCRYLLTLFSGLSISSLHHWIDEYWEQHSKRQWIWEVVESLYDLAEKEYPIWILSGTPTVFLLPLKRILPIDEVVGMDFELDQQGLITGNHSGISCAGEGKARKLLHLLRQNGEQNEPTIAFCAGNGSLDGPMMELARIAWSVYPNPQFQKLSESFGWFVLPRPDDFIEEEKFLLEGGTGRKEIAEAED
jgi:HAD superfamily phosphoserine phosphatase-like hydrolase